MKLLRGFADGRTDGRTNKQTFVIVESLSRLKIGNPVFSLGDPASVHLHHRCISSCSILEFRKYLPVAVTALNICIETDKKTKFMTNCALVFNLD